MQRSKLFRLFFILFDRVIYYKNIFTDPRSPLRAKLLLAFTIGYLIMPFDLVPDFIPFFGQLDDLVIVMWLLTKSIKMIPEQIKRDHRRENGA